MTCHLSNTAARISVCRLAGPLWARIVLAAGLACLFSAGVVAQAGASLPVATINTGTVVPEYNAKAGYLLLFCRYVEWPAPSFAAPGAPIVIGILGEDPFGDVLARTVAGQVHDRRVVVVTNPRTADEARRCQIVFIPRANQRQQPKWIEELRGAPVLTVVETAEGLADGAVIAFATESGARGTRLKFDASLPAAERAGIRISAPMLSAARRVLRDTTTGGGK